MQEMPWALVLDLDKAGNSRAARMAMIAMTTNSSINVKARHNHLSPRQVTGLKSIKLRINGSGFGLPPPGGAC